MGMTTVEKILASASGRSAVKAGEYVTAAIGVAMTQESMKGIYGVLKKAGVQRLWNPERVVTVLDHYVPAPSIQAAENFRLIRRAIEEYGIPHAYENAGICHQILVEKGFVLPGEVIVGSDSHTVTYGALGAAGTGIGITEMAYVLAKGTLWFRVPETVKIRLNGTLGDGMSSKDILLFIAGTYGSEVAQYQAIEFCGPVARAMTLASRMAMSNMSVEIGAKFGFFEADEKTTEYLESRARRPYRLVVPDGDAAYARDIAVDCCALEPQVACPHTIANVKPVSEVRDVPIDQAFLGSCTNGRLGGSGVGGTGPQGTIRPPEGAALGVAGVVGGLPAGHEAGGAGDAPGGWGDDPQRGLRAVLRGAPRGPGARGTLHLLRQSELPGPDGQSGGRDLPGVAANRGGVRRGGEDRRSAGIFLGAGGATRWALCEGGPGGSGTTSTPT